MLVMSNADNNNKFYEIKLEEDDSVVCRYGRVGVTGLTENKGFGEAIFDKIANAKKKKGYKEVNILTTTLAVKASSNIVEIAKRDIAKNNPVLNNLIEKLAKINRHQLLGASGGNIDIVDGQVKTALGLVTIDAVNSAKNKLSELNTYVSSGDLSRQYVTCLEDYLTLIPQKIPSKKGWHNTFFTDFTNFQVQFSLLDQIENSIKNYQPPVETAQDITEQKLFGYSIELLEDNKIFDDINKFYNSGISTKHVTKNYKLKKVYVLHNDDKKKIFDDIAKKLGNVKQLWHGSRACNILSIMKKGLIIPPADDKNYTIAGRMFGNNLYMSDQSTKSLNYSTPYWTGGSKELDEIFMFIMDAALGKQYIPSGQCKSIPRGYDSIFAIGGRSGVINNEMMVPNVDQIWLKYLCEFSE